MYIIWHYFRWLLTPVLNGPTSYSVFGEDRGTYRKAPRGCVHREETTAALPYSL